MVSLCKEKHRLLCSQRLFEIGMMVQGTSPRTFKVYTLINNNLNMHVSQNKDYFIVCSQENTIHDSYCRMGFSLGLWKYTHQPFKSVKSLVRFCCPPDFIWPCQIFLNRKKAVKSLGYLASAINRWKRSVAISPEGTRSVSGQVRSRHSTRVAVHWNSFIY